jgi:hypothetical protein
MKVGALDSVLRPSSQYIILQKPNSGIHVIAFLNVTRPFEKRKNGSVFELSMKKGLLNSHTVLTI